MSGNNPVKYVDPDGRQNMPYSSKSEYYNFWGTILYNSDDIGGKYLGLTMLNIGGTDISNESAKLTSTMLREMQNLAGEAVISGAQFMSENGSTIAIVAYASGNVGIGVTIDGITLVADAILIADEYNKTGDLTNAIIDTSIIVASNALGKAGGKKLVKSMGLDKKAFAEQIQPIAEAAISSAGSAVLDLSQEALSD